MSESNLESCKNKYLYDKSFGETKRRVAPFRRIVTAIANCPWQAIFRRTRSSNFCCDNWFVALCICCHFCYDSSVFASIRLLCCVQLLFTFDVRYFDDHIELN